MEEEERMRAQHKVSSLLNHLLWDLQNPAVTLTVVCLQGVLPSNDPSEPTRDYNSQWINGKQITTALKCDMG